MIDAMMLAFDPAEQAVFQSARDKLYLSMDEDLRDAIPEDPPA
jgi:hypothetical protein